MREHTPSPEAPFLATEWEVETLERLTAYAKVAREASRLCRVLEENAPGIAERQRTSLREALDDAYNLG